MTEKQQMACDAVAKLGYPLERVAALLDDLCRADPALADAHPFRVVDALVFALVPQAANRPARATRRRETINAPADTSRLQRQIDTMQREIAELKAAKQPTTAAPPAAAEFTGEQSDALEAAVVLGLKRGDAERRLRAILAERPEVARDIAAMTTALVA